MGVEAVSFAWTNCQENRALRRAKASAESAEETYLRDAENLTGAFPYGSKKIQPSPHTPVVALQAASTKHLWAAELVKCYRWAAGLAACLGRADCAQDHSLASLIALSTISCILKERSSKMR